MHRLSEFLDGAIKRLVLMCFVVGMVTGTVYFLTVGQVNLEWLSVFSGVAMAIALEVGSLAAVTAFHNAQHHLDRSIMPDMEDVYIRQRKWALVNVVGFSTLQIASGIGFRFSVWHNLPWWLIIGYGLAIPVVFLMFSFIEHQVIEAEDIQNDTQRRVAIETARHGRDIALTAVSVSARHTKGRIKKAARTGKDFSPMAIALHRRFGDDEGAHTLMVVDSHLRQIEGLEPQPYAMQWVNPDEHSAILIKADAQHPVKETVPLDMKQVSMEIWEKASRILDADITISRQDLASQLGVSQATASKIFAKYCEVNNITEIPRPAIRKRNRARQVTEQYNEVKEDLTEDE